MEQQHGDQWINVSGRLFNLDHIEEVDLRDPAVSVVLSLASGAVHEFTGEDALDLARFFGAPDAAEPPAAPKPATGKRKKAA